MKKKIENATWTALPLYSDLESSAWRSVLQKDTFIKELWPAQHLLGRADVLRGQSAVVQMPTSAGKTRATEIVIRSAFLAERASLAVVIAPFRALCHEIRNSLASAFHGESIQVDELSDTFQADFDIAQLLGHKQILIVTPEKLLYVLRHTPELASYIGLAIFDEGHQFDSGKRGITYELLLTSLRSVLPDAVQKLLISAVISNADAVGKWLNGDPTVVAGTNLSPTLRSIGFASWLDQLGRIEFVANDNPEEQEYFVPRVIESFRLKRKSKREKSKVFPDKSNSKVVGKEIALYLGLKLVPQGSVAVFCGRKDTASSLLSMVVERFSRELPMEKPQAFSDGEEIARLLTLIRKNLGSGSDVFASAELGVFSHHGNTPQGIRLAVEHAMREGQIRFVVCTSTLAQGVNLPIRYLIVTSIYQGSERIKVRDFHNLIGRAGRAGMHTEGSVLFADPIVYDKKGIRAERWRWNQAKELLEPDNSEPCVSTLLTVFDPIKSDDERVTINMNALDFAEAYVNSPEQIARLAEAIVKQHSDKNFSRDGVERQIDWKINLITSIESFLMSHLGDEGALSEDSIDRLAEGTLAFFLADEPRKEHLRRLFRLVGRHVSSSVADPARRIVYGRTLFGIRDSLAIEEWVRENIDQLFVAEEADEILHLIWPLLSARIDNRVFRKLDKPNVLEEVTRDWMRGEPFYALLETMERRNARLIWGTQRRKLKIDQVVDLCEGGLAYDGMLLTGAIIEFSALFDDEGTEELIDRLQLFQKQLKYGLPNRAAITLYEMGFSDRVVAQQLSSALGVIDEPRHHVTRALRRDIEAARATIEAYPSYYHERLNEYLGPA